MKLGYEDICKILGRTILEYEDKMKNMFEYCRKLEDEAKEKDQSNVSSVELSDK